MKTRFPQTTLLIVGLIAGVAIGRYAPMKGKTEEAASHTAQGGDAARALHAGPPLRQYKRGDRPAGHVDVQSVLSDLASTDWLDMVAMVNAVGRLHALSDSQVRQAWSILLQASPGTTYQEHLAALYLWSRMSAIEPGTTLPDGWNFDDYPDALAAEQARQNMQEIETRIRAGQPVPDVTRRLYFQGLIRRDPWAALDAWLELSNPGDHVAEAGMFSSLLIDPSSRDKVLEKLRSWPAAEGLVNDLILSIAQPWIVSDTAAAQQWIAGISEPTLRKSLDSRLDAVAAARSPVSAWQTSESKTGAERTAIRSHSLRQLAYQDPAAGSRLLESVADPAERADLVRSFSSMLAAKDYGAWKSWRDALPAADSQQANAAGFNSWANEEPAAAGEWLNQQPAGIARDTMASELVRLAASTHPDIAAQWIRSIVDPRTRQSAVTVAITNIRPDDQAAMQTILSAAINP